MRKTILSIAAAASMFAFIPGIKAQKNMLLGVEGTPQMSWLYNTDDMDNNSFENINTLNGSFGVSWQFNFTKSSGIGINALYSYQGQRYKLAGIERSKRLEYVKIPLMYVYTSDMNSDVMFIGKIGPQLGMLMNAKLVDAEGTLIIDNQTDAYENFEISGVVSAGVGFKMGERFLFDLSLRADCGFTDAEDKSYKLNINDPVIVQNGNGSSINTRAMTNNVTAGITFGFRYIIAYD